MFLEITEEEEGSTLGKRISLAPKTRLPFFLIFAIFLLISSFCPLFFFSIPNSFCILLSFMCVMWFWKTHNERSGSEYAHSRKFHGIKAFSACACLNLTPHKSSPPFQILKVQGLIECPHNGLHVLVFEFFKITCIHGDWSRLGRIF